VDYYGISLHGFFIMIFFKIIFVNFIFFNIELVENYNYNKAKSCAKSTVAFLTKHCGLLQCLSTRFFFSYNFFKIIFNDFIYLILIWLRVTIISKAKSCGDAL